jgi:hypothetical protein
MSVPPLPPSLETLGKRPFSFYPPVLNIEHNEWIFQKSSWSEFLVTNSKTGMEVWVPRRFLGEVSRVDEPVMIVGLKRELEYRAGTLVAHERRVIEMPKAVNDHARPPLPEQAPPSALSSMGLSMNDGAESKIGKVILGALAVGLLVTFLVVSYFRSKSDVNNVTFVPIVQQQLGLTARDEFGTVVRKLGQPSEDRWRPETGEMQYRILRYPEKGIYVILMGMERDKARYIGSMDESWKPVDSVELPQRGNTRAMLNKLAKF